MCQHKPQNCNSPKLFFCCSINRLQHYVYRRRKNPLLHFWSRCFYMKEQLLCNLKIFDYKFCILYSVLSLYLFLPRTALRTTHSPVIKSNGGTVAAHYVSFAREKSLTSFTPGKLCI